MFQHWFKQTTFELCSVFVRKKKKMFSMHSSKPEHIFIYHKIKTFYWSNVFLITSEDMKLWSFKWLFQQFVNFMCNWENIKAKVQTCCNKDWLEVETYSGRGTVLTVKNYAIWKAENRAALQHKQETPGRKGRLTPAAACLSISARYVISCLFS